MASSRSFGLLFLCTVLCFLAVASAFTVSPGNFLTTTSTSSTTSASTTTALNSQKAIPPPRKKYIPKWKKKKTLAEVEGPPTDLSQIGLKGNIKVIFKTAGTNETKSTMALAGQPLRDVATQAGQYIKYGCGKGECGTCESLVNGQWIRPCSTKLPAVAQGEEYVIQVKQTKAKTVSSGRFYSARSIVLGFWNNLLGMVGLVRDRRLAKKNWNERKEYEDLVRQKTLEKKRARMVAGETFNDDNNNNKPNSKLAP